MASGRRFETGRPVVVLKLAAQGALGAVRSLGRLGVPIYGVHEDDRSPAAGSRYLRRILRLNIDTTPAPEAAQRLVRFGHEIGGRPLLLASDDVGALFVDERRELGESFDFSEQPPGLPRQLYNKRLLFGLCRELGVPTPDTAFPGNRADVERWIEEVGRFPVIVKPSESWRLDKTGLTMRITHDADELLEAYERLEDREDPFMMLQDYIPGGAESVWMFNAYFDGESRCSVGFTGQKLRQYPAYVGMTSLGICRRNDDVEELATSFLTRIGYRGLVDLGVRYDERDGRYKVLDVNPRLGNSFRLFAAREGLDVVRALYLDLTGQQLPEARLPEGRKWLVENFDVGATARYLRDGALSPREWARSFRGVEETAWWASDDPRPFARVAGAAGAAIGRRLRRFV